VLPSANGLRNALTTPDTSGGTARTTLGCTGFGVDGVLIVTAGDATGDCVGSEDPLVTAVVSSCLVTAGASCFTSEAADTAAVRFGFVGLAAGAADRFFRAGLVGGVSSVTLAGGSAASAFVSVVLDDVDPTAPSVSSAHARPLCQPVMTAAPMPRATVKPPTLRSHAPTGMRNVYRLGAVGAPELR